MHKNSEWRAVKINAEARTEEDKKKLYLRGYPILFNNPTTIRTWDGDATEIVSPDALRNTELRDVYLLVGHNPDNVLGRSGANMRFEIDETGLFFECELPNTQLARDWYNLIESGIVDGMSFGFNAKFNDERDEDGRLIKRTVADITKLYEITITPFPAYEEASVVARNENLPAGEPKKGESAADIAETQTIVENERAAIDELLKKLEEL